MWETGSDAEVYESRSKIAQALTQIIDFISFDMDTRRFRVIIGAGIVAYEFDKQGRVTNKFDLAESAMRKGPSPLTVEHFAQADGTEYYRDANGQQKLTPETRDRFTARLEKLTKLMLEKQTE